MWWVAAGGSGGGGAGRGATAGAEARGGGAWSVGPAGSVRPGGRRARHWRGARLAPAGPGAVTSPGPGPAAMSILVPD